MAAIKRVIVSSVPGTLPEGTEVFVEDGVGGLDLYIGNSSNTPVLVSGNQFASINGSDNETFSVNTATEDDQAVPKSQAVISDDIRIISQLTQTEYDALDPADPNTLYIIVDE